MLYTWNTIVVYKLYFNNFFKLKLLKIQGMSKVIYEWVSGITTIGHLSLLAFKPSVQTIFLIGGL